MRGGRKVLGFVCTLTIGLSESVGKRIAGLWRVQACPHLQQRRNRQFVSVRLCLAGDAVEASAVQEEWYKYWWRRVHGAPTIGFGNDGSPEAKQQSRCLKYVITVFLFVGWVWSTSAGRL